MYKEALQIERDLGDLRAGSGDWLELGGCGMVHPNVLRAGGLDSETWSGFAFGFGIDRMAKERHQVGDIANDSVMSMPVLARTVRASSATVNTLKCARPSLR